MFKTDCLELLNRALDKQVLSIFGEDGNGRYGKNDRPIFPAVNQVTIEFDSYSDDPALIEAYATVHLTDYNSSIYGYAITDHNLRISLNTLLAKSLIDPTSLIDADVGMQGDTFITFKVDVAKLLEW